MDDTFLDNLFEEGGEQSIAEKAEAIGSLDASAIKQAFPDGIRKKDISIIAQKFADEMNERSSNMIEEFVALDTMLKVLTEVHGIVKEKAIKSASQYGKGENFVCGVEFTVKNGAARYSFDHDKTIKHLEDELEKVSDPIKTKIKARQEAMKKAVGTSQYVVDGEIVPPAKIEYQKDTVALTYKP